MPARVEPNPRETKARQAPAPPLAKAEVLTAARGETKAPASAPEDRQPLKEPVKSAPDEAPRPHPPAEMGSGGQAKKADAEGNAAGSSPHGASGGTGLEGAGEGLPAPPRGSGLVAALPRLVYPKAAQNAGARGTVGLQVTVGRDGRLLKVEVDHPSGVSLLDDYARRAVERGLVTRPWLSSYVVRVEVHFSGGAPELRVLDEPVQVVGG